MGDPYAVLGLVVSREKETASLRLSQVFAAGPRGFRHFFLQNLHKWQFQWTPPANVPLLKLYLFSTPLFFVFAGIDKSALAAF